MVKQKLVFVHGMETFGAAAWPQQHGMALGYDALFLRRHGYDAVAEPAASDFTRDAEIVLEALAGDEHSRAGGHVVAHDQGAIAAMMAAVERPDLVFSLTLVEPACLSLTSELPATVGHRAGLEPLFAARAELTDEQYHREFSRRVYSSSMPLLHSDADRRAAHRLRLQAPPWEAPLSIVPGVPTLVITGGWEPLYEEIAGYLGETGAQHLVVPGGHRPQDSPEGSQAIRTFIASVAQAQAQEQAQQEALG